MKTGQWRLGGDRQRAIAYRPDPRQLLDAWAQTFDVLGIRWESQPLDADNPSSGFALYLPQSGQWLVPIDAPTREEVRHIERCDQTARADYAGESDDLHVFAGLPDGSFRGYRARWRYGVGLYQCLECNGWWFLDTSLGWACRCCGASDGNAHVDERFVDRISPWRYVESEAPR